MAGPYQDQPFREDEERYFLAEILKRSNIPPVTLINLIRETQIDPLWNEIALPSGRSVLSCQYAFNNLHTRASQSQQQGYQLPAQPQYQAEAQRKSMKRPYSMGDVTTPIAREIQPRPPLFPGMQPQATQSPMAMSPVEPPRKKRGRPTKAEAEKRTAEAQAKGEIWPKPRNKNPKARRMSEATESRRGESMDDSGGEASTAARPLDETMSNAPAPIAVMSPPVQRGSLQAIMLPAGQAEDEEMRDEGGGPVRPGQGPDPFYAPPQTIMPRITGSPRGSGINPPPFSPRLNNQYQPGGHPSPAGRQ